MTTQSQSLRLADQLIQGYAWPGGYPLFGLFSDGGVCCSDCARSERKLIGTTTGQDGWGLVGVDANWEDPSLYCDNCNSRIESAYAESEANPLETLTVVQLRQLARQAGHKGLARSGRKAQLLAALR